MGLDWTLASDEADPSAAADRARCSDAGQRLPAFERPLPIWCGDRSPGELGEPEPMNRVAATRRDILALAAAAALGAWPARAQVGSPSEPFSAEAGYAAFDEVWEIVRDRFYDPRLHGLDWQAMRARYRPQAASARSREDMAVAVNAMLAELGASHTHYYTREDPAYYQLADIFSDALRHRGLQRVFPTGEVTYPGIGAFTQSDDQSRTFVTGVIEGGPRTRQVSCSAMKSYRWMSARFSRSNLPRQGRGLRLDLDPPHFRRGNRGD